MTEKQNYSQAEFFSSGDNGGQYRAPAPRNPFFLRIRGYEKIMLSIMGAVLIAIISFSLGVEKGRRVALLGNNTVSQSGYTIQVATFKNRQLALREAQSLQSEGLSPMVFTKGDYIVLCVGKFSNQDSAQPLLIQLQRTYAGCRIRRL